MNRNMLKLIGTGIIVLIVLLVILLVWQSLANLGERSRDSGIQVARQAVERAIMQCYALEGAYPPSLDYLREHYGLVVDTVRYAYVYEVVGGNIHPVVSISHLEDVQS
jgi:competence protein ComGC